MSRANQYTLIARVSSASHPGDVWDVKTDGSTLTCSCPIWVFRRRPPDSQGRRTCRHTDEVYPQVEALGGIQAALAALRRGSPVLVGSEAGTQRPARQRRAGAATAPLTVVRADEACDLGCGNQFFSRQERCRHGRTILAAIASLGVVEQPVEQDANLPDWLGGRRNIILRD